MDKVDILARYHFYTDASSAAQQEFEDAAMLAQLQAGDRYFHEGDSCNQIALLGKGSVRVYKTGESGREITLYHVRAGETCILTASCVLAHLNYPASAVAEEDTEAVVFPAGIFRTWVAVDERVRQFVFETLATRMASVLSLVEEITFNKMDRRLAEYLKTKFCNEGRPVRVIQATHEHIAGELGSAREVISRLLKEFEREGAIELARGRILLRDADILQKLKAQA